MSSRASRILKPVAFMALSLLMAERLQSAPAAGVKNAFAQENMAAMDRMMAGMNVPASGNVDRDFTSMMIPHHQGAIDMAQALLRYGKNEELKTLARGIIKEQREEIAIMRRIGGTPAPAAAPMDHHHMR